MYCGNVRTHMADLKPLRKINTYVYITKAV